MARINFEVEEVVKDKRFIDLVFKTGSRATAYGLLLEAYVLAQRYWIPNQNKIPVEVFLREASQDLIDVGWAILENEEVYVCGSREQFAWLIQKVEAGKQGGINSGKSRREIKEKLSKRNEADSSEVKRREPSYSSSSSSSSSFSSSSSLSNSKQRRKKTEPTVADGMNPAAEQTQLVPVKSLEAEDGRRLASGRPEAKTKRVWEAYCDAYSYKYGHEPADNVKDRSLLSSLIDRIGKEDAVAVAGFYVSHPNRFYIEKGHPVWLMLQDAQKLRTEWMSGRVVTSNKAREVERRHDLLDAFGLTPDGKEKHE